MVEPEPVAIQAPAPEATQADLDSIAALTTAAQNPALQFQASAQLGRLLLRIGRVRDGTVTVVKAGPMFQVLAENKLPDEIAASPAISNGRIYLRGWKALYAIGPMDK